MKPLPPVCKRMCATCPFRAGSKYGYLRAALEASAMTEASRVCHSTDSGNGINYRTGKPARICRGARDVQLSLFHRIGYIAAPTDAAWARKWAEVSTAKSK